MTAAIEAASRAAEDAVAAADAPTASGPVLLPPSETSSELIPLSRGDPSGLELVVRELQASLREALGAKVAAETDARETRRRAVDLAERLANAQADADELASLRAAALRDGAKLAEASETTKIDAATLHARLATTESKLASMREDNESQHRDLEDLKRSLRESDRALEEARSEAEVAARRAERAKKDAEAAERAADALRKQAAESDDLVGDSVNGDKVSSWAETARAAEAEARAVSYTHLTLPTILRV